MESHGVKRFETSGGALIFQIPLHVFPMLWGNVYLVVFESEREGTYQVLVDAGSGFGDSDRHLEEGLQAVSAQRGEGISRGNLTHVFITHGHIDHFGGLKYVRPRTQAQIGVHELDVRNLTHYEERLVVVSRRLNNFLIEAGVDAGRRGELIDLYKITKNLYSSAGVDFTYEAAGMRLGPFEMLHVPGHCAGHVVIRLHDVLFSGDHVLIDISPHQSPWLLTSFTGLEHYLRSLDLLEGWASGVRLSLAGHEEPIYDLKGRLEEIRNVHRERLERVLELMSQPRTVLDISKELFGDVHGYNVLLALEEAGAHVEYLYQRGLIGIENLDELADGREAVAIRYLRSSLG